MHCVILNYMKIGDHVKTNANDFGQIIGKSPLAGYDWTVEFDSGYYFSYQERELTVVYQAGELAEKSLSKSLSMKNYSEDSDSHIDSVAAFYQEIADEAKQAKAKLIYSVLMGQDFADWHNGRFQDHVVGTDIPKVTKDDVLEDIKKLFKL